MPLMMTADMLTNERRRNQAFGQARGFVHDVQGFFDQTPEEAWSQVQRGAAAGVSRAPGTLWNMVTHPAETVWGMTGEPLVRREQAIQDQDRAEIIGDEAAADEAARQANVALRDTGINAGGFAVGGRTLGLFGSTARGRGIPAYLAQTANASTTGGALGGATGFLTTPGDLEERTAGAAEAGGVGAGLGLVAPAAVNAVRVGGFLANNAPRPLGGQRFTDYARSGVYGARRYFEDATNPDPNGVGAFGRPPRRRAPPPQREEPIPEEGRIVTMFDRARMSGDALIAEHERAVADPQGQVLVDLAGDTGTRTLRPVVQSPGETGARAEPIVRERFGSAPSILTERLQTDLGVSRSRAEALARLEGDYRGATAQAYKHHWREPTAREHQLYEERIKPLLENENPNLPYREARWSAAEQFDLDRAAGRVTGELTDNLARYLHYIKVALGEVADFEAAPPLRGTSGQRIASRRELYRQFGNLLDPENGEAIIPGYRETTARAGDYFAARRGLEQGADWLGMRADEIRASRERMSPFELEHARIGYVDALAEMLGERGRVNGTANVANSPKLNSPAGQDRIRAVFDSPEQAARFIETINTQHRLMSNAQQWGGNSATHANEAFGLDAAMHTLRALKSPEGWLYSVAKYLELGAIERGNNQFGGAALRRVDNAESRVFVRRLARLLRERAARREAASAASRTAAATGGAQPSRDTGRGR